MIECSKRHSHDWTTCPFAHPNEKARRRDPRKVHYTGVFCPYIRQGQDCPHGENCPCSHNTFEYWLHPSRYRTQFCNIAASCNRNVCFFAHSIEELRVPGNTNSDPVSYNPNMMNPDHQSMFLSFGESGPMSGSMNLGVSFSAQARQILDQLLTARRLSSTGVRGPLTAADDLSEIHTLNFLIGEHSRSAGISETNPILQSQFMNSLFSALFDEVCRLPVSQTTDRERLLKLLRWMYVQVVQNREPTGNLDPNLTLNPVPPLSLDIPPQQQFQQSLTRIPESVEAQPTMPPLLQIPQLRSTASFDGGMRSWSGGNIQFSPVTTVGGDDLRNSNESANTRMSGTTRLSLSSLNRSSNESFQSFDRLASGSAGGVILSRHQQFPSVVHTGVPGAGGNVFSVSSALDQDDVAQIPEFLYADWMSQNQASGPGQ